MWSWFFSHVCNAQKTCGRCCHGQSVGRAASKLCTASCVVRPWRKISQAHSAAELRLTPPKQWNKMPRSSRVGVSDKCCKRVQHISIQHDNHAFPISSQKLVASCRWVFGSSRSKTNHRIWRFWTQLFQPISGCPRMRCISARQKLNVTETLWEINGVSAWWVPRWAHAAKLPRK